MTAQTSQILDHQIRSSLRHQLDPHNEHTKFILELPPSDLKNLVTLFQLPSAEEIIKNMPQDTEFLLKLKNAALYTLEKLDF
jgi:hypothetical protein